MSFHRRRKRRMAFAAALVSAVAVVFGAAAFYMAKVEPAIKRTRLRSLPGKLTNGVVLRELEAQGDEGVALATRAVDNKKTPGRELLIEFLARNGNEAAVAPLTRIAEDKTETENLRRLALEAIKILNSERARALAVRLQDEPGLIGDLARRMVQGDEIGLDTLASQPVD